MVGDGACSSEPSSSSSDSVQNKVVEFDSKIRRIIVKDHPALNCERTGKALKEDAHHAFQNIVDNFIRYAHEFQLEGSDELTRRFFQIEGSLNGKDGVFEWVYDQYIDKVTHRRFIPHGKVTGTINQRVYK